MKTLAHLSVIPALLSFPTWSGLFLLAFLLAACGDNVENNTINQMGMDVVDSEDDLPECTDENEGELAFVKDEDATRVCIGGKWKPTAPGTSAADISCKTVELKDKSGLKIVCNGDSIGVVLNGSDGKDGKDAEVVKSDTTVNDSERIAISLDSLVGVTQKGPFLKGSTVYLYELTDGRTLKQTNGNFTSNITGNDGRYKFTARDLVSQYAMVVVDGYYRNEVTGKTSEAPIRLKAITDMRKRSSVNVNILTQLEFDRVYHLVTRGNKDGKKLTVKQAKRQAQREIMDIFNIKLDEDTDAEDMDVFGSSDADAALLAISILLQGDRSESDMMALLSEISNDMAEDGEWNADSMKALIADWAFGQNLSKFRKNVEGWGLNNGGEIGDFEKYINNFIIKTLGLKSCNGAKDSTLQTVGNESSLYKGRSYQCFEKPDDCDKCEMWVEVRPKSQYMNESINYGYIIDWRDRRMYHTFHIYQQTCHVAGQEDYSYSGEWLAENLDHVYRVDGKVYGNHCYKNDCEKYGSFGRLYTWAAAMDSAGLYSKESPGCGMNVNCVHSSEVRGVCPEGWRVPSQEEWMNLISFLGREYGEYNADLFLKSKTAWDDEGCVQGNDKYGFSMVPNGFCSTEDNCGSYGRTAYLWSSTDVSLGYVSGTRMSDHDTTVFLGDPSPDLGMWDLALKNYRYGVRCVKRSNKYPEHDVLIACGDRY